MFMKLDVKPTFVHVGLHVYSTCRSSNLINRAIDSSIPFFFFKAASSLVYTSAGFNFMFGKKYVRLYSPDYQCSANILCSSTLSKN